MNAVTTFQPLSSHSTGLIVIAAFALISALALAFICGRTILLGVKLLLRRDDEETSKIPEMLFFCTQLGHYAASLVLSNVLITISGLFAFCWISSGGVSAGLTCQAQAILMQTGIWGNCYFTVAHGVHTFNSLILRFRQPRWLSAMLITLGWSTALVAALAPLQNGNVYGPTDLSCSIASGSRMETFMLQILPITLAAALSIIVYCLIFLSLGGRLSISGTDKLRKLTLKAQRGLDEFEEYRRFISTIIRTMFWFPFAFVVLLLPDCIVHLMLYAGCPVPYALTVFAHVCCSLLGFVNVGLLVNTYRVVRPIVHGPKQDGMTVQTFGNSASDESPIEQKPQPTIFVFPTGPATIPSYKSSPMRTSGHFANHSRTDSSSSADSSTGLLEHQKSRKYNHGGVIRGQNILSPAELSRQISDGIPISQKRKSGLRISPFTGSQATVSLSPPPPRVLSGGLQSDSELSAKEQKHLTRQTTEAFGKVSKDLAFKAKAPPALDLLPSSVVGPSPPSMRQVTNKSAILATRLGISPKPSPTTPSAPSAGVPVPKLDKGKGKASPPLFTPIRKNSNVHRPPVVLEVRPFDVVRPSMSVPDSDSDSDTTDSDATSDLGYEIRVPRMSITTPSASYQPPETMQPPLQMEAYLARRELEANTQARKGPERGVNAVPGRQWTPAGPRGPKPAHPVNVASYISSPFTRTVAPTWSPTGNRNSDFKLVLGPNDSAV